jgi:hypothetical protein
MYIWKVEPSMLPVKSLLERLTREFPRIQYGYFNRTREKFYPEGFETGWPVA